MPIIVQKYGGTSVGTVERIQAVADRVVRAREDGNDVVVVVSAMGHTTDELLAMASEIAVAPDPRELDMLLTAGERIAMSLLGIAINARGCRAASYTGSQAGIMTDTQHGSARIVEIRPKRIFEALEGGSVVVLAGFQGLSLSQYEITTLGRGGSDLTAVAMASAIGAGVCEIYTDVTGVYTTDPRIEPRARKLDVVSYDEMLELAAAGANVLQSRSVEYARRTGVRLHVRSSFEDEVGTWIQEAEEPMEGVLISGVALDTDEAKVTLERVPDRPGVAATVFKAIADDAISIDMIVQNVSHAGATDLSFTAPRADLPRVHGVMERLVKEIGADSYTIDDDIAKLSLVGAGMKNHPGVAADMFDSLAGEGINIEMISTSPIRISCVIRAADGERAVRVVHGRFSLDESGSSPEIPTG
ncbi:MAG: aspartate kinase [Actinomycetota bacterium]|nr:aspartate kinase [Actinomycetota bacterium]MDH5224188.1 aspartate kinase [Actinomycetota bacterium]